MRLHRFIGNFDLAKKQINITDKDFLNQAKNVLRFKVGDKIVLCDGNVNEAAAEIINLDNKIAELKILEIYKNESEPKNHVTLYCPILKKENFEIAVQKAVEVGVKEIIPVITKRTVKLGLSHARLNKIIKEAAEQSDRGILPKLREAVSFDEAVEQAKANDLNYFFNTGNNMGPVAITSKTSDRLKCAQCKIGVFVGPEGGWDEAEIKKAQSHGFAMAGLGKLTLRAETAVIIASYVVAC